MEKNPRNDIGFTPLHSAAQNGHFDVCQLILSFIQDKNPKSDITDITPLHYAAKNGHFEVCKLIVENVQRS